MNDDDYTDDATELAISRLPKAVSPLDDAATNPLQAVAPAAVRERFAAAYEADEKTVERAGLSSEDLANYPFPGGDVDATLVPEEPLVPKPVRPRPRNPSQLQPKVPRPNAPRVMPVAPAPTPQEPPAPARSQYAQAEPRVERSAAPQVDTGSGNADQLRRLGLSRRKRPNANHVRANSGFYSLPEANSAGGTVDATVIGEFRSEADNRDALGLLVALGLGLATGLGMLALALGRWSTPGAVMALTLLAMVVCAAVTAGVVLPQNEVRLSGIRRAFLPMGISVALNLIVGLGWQLGVVREALRPLASSAPEMSALVLADDSLNVAVAECVRLTSKLDSRAYRNTLVEGLAGRTDLSLACLRALDSAGADNLSSILADRWHGELVGGGVDGDHACDLANSLVMLPRPAGELETRLLTCVLAGPTVAVESCCGVALVKHVASADANWVATVQRNNEYIPDEKTAEGLMTLAFHQMGVTTSQREFVKAANFNDVPGRTLALSFACEALQNGATGLSKHFAASLGECAIDESRVPRSREVWNEVCDIAMARVAKKKVEPARALCDATRVALVSQAVADAARIVAQASKNRRKNREMAIAIDVEGSMTRGNLKDAFKALSGKRPEANATPPPSAIPEVPQF